MPKHGHLAIVPLQQAPGSAWRLMPMPDYRTMLMTVNVTVTVTVTATVAITETGTGTGTVMRSNSYAGYSYAGYSYAE